jgi:hypothetical protein
MRDVKGTHELSRNARRRGEMNEVQEAVQTHNKKDHARKIPGDCGSEFHTRILLFDGGDCMTSIILMSIELMLYTYGKLQGFFNDPRRSKYGSRLDSDDEGDARPD